MNYKSSLKVAWLHHVTRSNFGSYSHLTLAEDDKVCTQMGYIKSHQKNEKSPPKRLWLWSRDLFMYLAIYNISGMAKVRDFKFCTVVCRVVH